MIRAWASRKRNQGHTLKRKQEDRKTLVQRQQTARLETMICTGQVVGRATQHTDDNPEARFMFWPAVQIRNALCVWRERNNVCTVNRHCDQLFPSPDMGVGDGGGLK